MEYAAERAEQNGTHRLSELAALLSDVKRLPDLGFPDLAGLQDMPEELFSEASMLAADFVDLVVQSMVQLAWDTSWWSQAFPNAFARLLHPNTESVTRTGVSLFPLLCEQPSRPFKTHHCLIFCALVGHFTSVCGVFVWKGSVSFGCCPPKGIT